MKRTTLMLDERLVEEALRLSDERTVSDLVRRALADLVRRIRSRQVLEFRGSGVWSGDLAEMRGDARARAPRRPRRRA